MRGKSVLPILSGQVAVLALASVFALPGGAQQTQPTGTPQDTAAPAPADQTQPDQSQQPPAMASPEVKSSSDVNQKRLENAHKEGFWGRVQPFARKKWVKKQTDPINDRLSELDQVNAKNAKEIQDVDARAQAGIRQAQSTADTANQTATAASAQAQQANTLAQGASGRVDQINTKVSGLDQYRPVNEVDVPFKRGPILSADAKKQLDDVVSSVNGRQGYIIEVEAHSPGRGGAGIQDSQRLANVVNRYLVEHDIPVYRVHAVALGNAQAANANNEMEAKQPLRTSSVHIRLMENSLAAREAASPQGAVPTTGAERP